MKLASLFRRADPPAKKDSAVGGAIVMTPGQPAWSGRDYGALSREGYAKNVVAFQAINRIADAVASVRWTVWRGETELTEHPILNLLRDPNPMQSGPQYMRAKTGFFLLSGNGYEERVTVRSETRELYQLRPDRMFVIQGANGFPQGYVYRVNGKEVRFQVDPTTGEGDVRHLKSFHPLNDWYGLSPIEAGAYAVDQNNEAMSWMQALLQNSARPSGALTTKDDATLSDDNFNRLKAQIEEQYSGSRNAGRPMLLEGGLSWQQMGLSPVDMQILETKYSSARDICLALGVPPQMLGIPGDNTYSNYQEARLAFWEDTVIPLLDLFAEDWTAWLGEPFGVKIKPDLDQVPAIVDKRARLWEMADKATDLTINERRALKGYEPIDGGDTILVGAAQVPLSMAGEMLSPLPDPDMAKALAYGPDEKK